MGDPDGVRNLAVLVVPDVGRLEATGDRWVPFRMLDANGISIEPVAAFFAELQAADRRPGTIRSYGHDLLRWWRFLAAVGVDWDRATSIEGRDFARWMMLADKPVRVHWRHRDGNKAAAPAPSRRDGGVNAVTGKPEPSSRYASSTRVHAEAVLRSFYDFQIELGGVRWSIRSHWIVHVGRDGAMLTGTRWMRCLAIGQVGTVRDDSVGYRRAFPMTSSTDCSQICARIGIVPCWRFGYRRAPVPTNCCRPHNSMWIRGNN